MKYKIIFFSVWTILILFAPITVLSVTPISEAFSLPVLTASFFQRIFGLLAYTLLFVQLILGSFMPTLTQKYGGWIYSFHIFEGIMIYALILIHPLLFVLFNYFVGTGFDPFYVFTQLCLICTKGELYYTFGRAAFWLFTITIATAFFRTMSPFLRKHWKKFHILNYVTFILIGIHSLGVGSDIGTPPFSFIHGPALAIITVITLVKIYNYLAPAKKK